MTLAKGLFFFCAEQLIIAEKGSRKATHPRKKLASATKKGYTNHISKMLEEP